MMLLLFIVVPFQEHTQPPFYKTLQQRLHLHPSTHCKRSRTRPLHQRNCRKLFNGPPEFLNFHGRSVLQSRNCLHQNLPSANESLLFHKSFHVQILIDCLLSLDTVVLFLWGRWLNWMNSGWRRWSRYCAISPVTDTVMEKGIFPSSAHDKVYFGLFSRNSG